MKTWKLTEEQKADLVQRRATGAQFRELAEIFGISATSASYIVRTRGSVAARLSEAQKVEAVSRYSEQGHSMQQIAGDLGVTKQAIFHLLRVRGVESRRVGAPGLPVKHDAFDTLTPDACYWIGFLFADGSVTSPENGASHSVIVGLSAVDRGHIVKLKSFLGSEHQITDIAPTPVKGTSYTRAQGVRFAVSSEQLGNRLISLGRYDGPVAPELVRSSDFWRGFVDGDGSLGIYRATPNGKPYPSFGLVGETRLLRAFNEFLEANGIEARPIHPHKSIWVVYAKHRPARQIVHLLYRENVPALARKDAKALEIMQLHQTAA